MHNTPSSSFDAKVFTDKKIALIVANGFDEYQFNAVQRTLAAQGGQSKIVSSESGLVSGVNQGVWGLNYPVNLSLGDVLSSDFDMIIVLGGASSVLRLSKSAHSTRILNSALENNIPVVMLSEAISLLKAVPAADGYTVSVSDTTAERAEGTTLKAVKQPWVSHQSLISGQLDENTNDVLTAMVNVFAAQPMKAAA